ncbi:MAG: MFS transporter, partial [Mycobacterium sp.]|nr:MFS transporter [Mycobacterium sp.]
MPSETATNQTAGKPGWVAPFSGGNGRASLVLAGGVAMYAVTVYVTGAVLPAMSARLHGEQLYAWVNTGFLAASIAGTAFASTFTARRGLRQAYVTAFAVFALGSAIISIAPTMSIVVTGRAVQGIGGGLLSALAYVAVNALLPQSLWGRATGLITAMWGIGGIAGPAIGGIFGRGDAWRTPFTILTAAAIGLGALAFFTVND